MHEWIQGHQAFLWWLALFSFGTFLVSLIVTPWLVIRMPADFFSRERRKQARGALTPLQIGVKGLRNILGVMFVVAGALMLVLPGQGVLVILIGVMLTDFPGKYRLARWLVARRAVRASIDWLRTRAGKEPLVIA